MNGMTPNCLDDFLFSNATDKRTLELILSRKLPFPFGGKTGILFHGTWGTGKTTLAQLFVELNAQEGLNLDGGGSSCLLVMGRETIRPSDKEGQRPVPGVFMIK